MLWEKRDRMKQARLVEMRQIDQRRGVAGQRSDDA